MRKVARNTRPRQDVHHARENVPVKFEDLCRIEPRLGDLYRQAVEIRKKLSNARRASRIWYAHRDETGKLRPGMVEQVERLVGYSAEKRDPQLTTSSAYDVAYHTIHDALCQRAARRRA